MPVIAQSEWSYQQPRVEEVEVGVGEDSSECVRGKRGRVVVSGESRQLAVEEGDTECKEDGDSGEEEGGAEEEGGEGGEEGDTPLYH